MNFRNLSTITTPCGEKFSTTQDSVHELSIRNGKVEKCRKNLSTKV